MTEKGIIEKILFDTITQFENAEHGNATTAQLLREGIDGGKLKDSEWIAEVLSNTEDSKDTEEPPSEDSKS